MNNTTDATRPTPLAGLQVLEFSHTIMGPCAGLLFADLGADVIKIEPAPHGDKTRHLAGFASGFFATFNRNKRSLAVDLKTQEGQALVHELVSRTDIVLDNYGPGTMDRLNCSWETLQNLNKKLIYLSLKGFLAGPWESRPALDEVVQFQSGLAYMTGPVGQPLRAGASIIDILGAVFGVTGTLAALRERDNTGKGQRVDSSLFESAAFLMAPHMAGGATTGQTIPPMSARKGAWGVYDVFHSIEGTALFIGVTSDAQWVRFCEVFRWQDLFADERLATNVQRTAAREWLIPELNQRFATLAYDQMLALCQQADISWSPVGQPEDLWSNEQLMAHGGLLDTALATVQKSAAQSTPIPAIPLSFGDARRRLPLVRQPPQLGEHSREILAQAQIDAEHIDHCINTGIVAAWSD